MLMVLPKPKTTTSSTLLVMPQPDIGTRFQILSEESQALRNLDVHFLPIALQIRRLLAVTTSLCFYVILESKRHTQEQNFSEYKIGR